jgi:hypothetical protein
VDDKEAVCVASLKTMLRSRAIYVQHMQKQAEAGSSVKARTHCDNIDHQDSTIQGYLWAMSDLLDDAAYLRVVEQAGPLPWGDGK